jgi:hypothetical protein
MTSQTRITTALALVFLLGGCSKPEGEPSDSASSELSGSGSRGPSLARRAKLERLAAIDALARLYVGHELRRDELVVLDARTEAAVVAALTARPDFRTGLSTRAAAFHAIDGRGPSAQASAPLDPNAPLADAFNVDPGEANRFGRWLASSLAPRVAPDVLARTDGALGQMTYYELLDALRTASKTGSGT